MWVTNEAAVAVRKALKTTNSKQAGRTNLQQAARRAMTPRRDNPPQPQGQGGSGLSPPRCSGAGLCSIGPCTRFGDA